VGQGAIESIIAAREADGAFRSFADFCNRIDLRLANKRVLESLVKVGALSAFGHPGRLLDALDDTLAAAQADQRERASGQISLFDLAAEPSSLAAPLPEAPEIPTRERLRWEKELLGLYLSDHPLGEVAERIGHFVTAYSGDLKDESLDGERVVVGGVVTGSRTVVTKAKATMAVVTLEDLQGAIEVVVFPRLYEQTTGTWSDGVILLVAGRIDHRGEEVSLLADAAWEWDAVAARGEAAFASEVAAGERGSRGRGRSGGSHANGTNGANGANGANGVNGRRAGNGYGRAEGNGSGSSPDRAASERATRPTAAMPPVPLPGSSEPIDFEVAAPDLDVPPLPEEARPQAVASASGPTRPVEAGPAGRLHVRFGGGIGPDVLQPAMATVRDILRGHPGGTRVIVHLPQGAGRAALPMELRSGVAYDAELVADVGRRLRPEICTLELVLADEALDDSA
jgi:hypothetical protein